VRQKQESNLFYTPIHVYSGNHAKGSTYHLYILTCAAWAVAAQLFIQASTLIFNGLRREQTTALRASVTVIILLEYQPGAKHEG